MDADPTFINVAAMDNQYHIFIVFFVYMHTKITGLANVNILSNYIEYPANGLANVQLMEETIRHD